MAAIETKAKRKPNWTQEECLLLVTLINENKHVLRSRLGPNLTSQMKRDTWKKISKQLNAFALTPFTTKEIKEKWTNILSTSETEISSFRKQSTITVNLINFSTFLHNPSLYRGEKIYNYLHPPLYRSYVYLYEIKSLMEHIQYADQ